MYCNTHRIVVKMYGYISITHKNVPNQNSVNGDAILQGYCCCVLGFLLPKTVLIGLKKSKQARVFDSECSQTFPQCGHIAVEMSCLT